MLVQRKAMTFDEIYRFFQDPPPIHLNTELTVCYVLSILLNKDSYGTELIRVLKKQYPQYRLSDTVLYSALKFLEEEEMITGYWKKLARRGRPRRMYQIQYRGRSQAQELALLWQDYTRNGALELATPAFNLRQTVSQS